MDLMFTEQCMYVTFDSEHIYLFICLFVWIWEEGVCDR